MTHTQGDWSVATIDGGASYDEIITMVNGCIVNIAAVFGAGEYSMACPNGGPEPSYTVCQEEAAANARLISAAPDLLAALEAIANLDPEKDSSEGLNEWGEADCFNQANSIARAAVAKAKEED